MIEPEATNVHVDRVTGRKYSVEPAPRRRPAVPRGHVRLAVLPEPRARTILYRRRGRELIAFVDKADAKRSLYFSALGRAR